MISSIGIHSSSTRNDLFHYHARMLSSSQKFPNDLCFCLVADWPGIKFLCIKCHVLVPTCMVCYAMGEFRSV